MNLKKGNHGFDEDVPQAEVVATTPNGDIFIVSEPNIFIISKNSCNYYMFNYINIAL
ncbi:SdiA-regulated domain-containing protein [Escherichia coli]|uniref:SdiA-regulated domain-containing protein n=1 Tax=Escherichia coli TaxID=562 RepID=UPI000A187A91|nr:hypothetical protein EBAG_04541 [Escherichia coli T426]